jgi:hypothetical protein
MVWMSVYAMSECGCGLMWSDVLHDGSMRGADEGHRKHLVGSGMKPRMCSCQFWYSSMRLHSSVYVLPSLLLQTCVGIEYVHG